MSSKELSDDDSISFSVIVPAFKKAHVLKQTLLQLVDVLHGLDLKYEIIVVIDGDLDNSKFVVSELSIPSLKTIVNDSNQGKGYSIKRGIEASRSTFAIGYIDADLDLNPIGLAQGFELLMKSDVDLLLGSKLHSESTVEYPSFRKFQSLVFSNIVRLLFSLGVKDTQTGLKVGRAAVFRRIGPICDTNGFAFDLEFVARANKIGLKLKEIPVILTYSFSSTVSFSKSLSAMLDLLRIRSSLYSAQLQEWISRDNGKF